MVRRRGPRLTAAQKTELCRRWRQGESLNAIGGHSAGFPSASNTSWWGPAASRNAYRGGARPTLRAFAKELNALMRDQREVLEDLR